VKWANRAGSALPSHGLQSEDTEEKATEEELDAEHDQGGGGNQAAEVGAVREALEAGLLPIEKSDA
jgi:hypothetical protein